MSCRSVISLTALALMLAACARRAPEAAPDAAPEASTPANVLVVPARAPADGGAVAPRLPVAPMPHEPGEVDLTNVDVGIEVPLPEIQRIEEVTVPGPVNPTDPIGAPPAVELKDLIGLPPPPAI